MTDTASSRDHSDPFWVRVRAALNARRPERQPAYGKAAIARSIGIRPKLGSIIEEEMARGWQSAAGRHVSLSLLVVEIDRFQDYFTAYGKDAADDCTRAIMGAIGKALPRDTDRCLPMGASGFVVVLPDLPALMARAMAARIAENVRHLGLAHKESHLGIVTISQGLAVTNPRGNYDRRFFEAGAEALKKAQRKGMGRLEGIDLRPALERKRKAA